MKLEGKVDLTAYNKAVESLLAWSNKSSSEIFKNEARQLFEQIIQGPKGQSGKRGLATPPQTQQQGKLAVKRDVYRAVKPIRAEDYADKSIQKAIRSQPYHVLQTLAERGVFGDRLKNTKLTWFLPWMHTEQRTKRGIVSKKSRPLYATCDIQRLKDYIKKRQNMVGNAKGGWVRALEQAGGKALDYWKPHEKAGVESHNWVGDNLFARGINFSAWASAGDEDRIVASAMANRIYSIESKVKNLIIDYAKRRGL